MLTWLGFCYQAVELYAESSWKNAKLEWVPFSGDGECPWNGQGVNLRDEERLGP